MQVPLLAQVTAGEQKQLKPLGNCHVFCPRAPGSPLQAVGLNRDGGWGSELQAEGEPRLRQAQRGGTVTQARLSPGVLSVADATGTGPGMTADFPGCGQKTG